MTQKGGVAHKSLFELSGQAESARARIVRAAAEALLESGYAGTSVRAIASRAGVAIGNLQYYFPTKSELMDRYRQVVSEQLDRLEHDGRVRLKIERDVLVPLILNTVLGFGLYYVVTRDEESCLRALSAWRQLAGSVVEPVNVTQ